ncbi:MAG: WYL domain-containing protein [Actinomycetes bacterium]
MAKVDRLLNLVAALIDTSIPLTAEQIYKRVPGYPESDESFHRAFERDKEALRGVGIPIEMVDVHYLEQPRAAYTILRDRYELADPGLDSEELAALHLAATMVQAEGLDPDDLEEGLRKLGGLTAAAAETSPVGAVPMPPQLLQLFAATLEQRVASFSYSGQPRQVEPYRLEYERGHWYMSGRDLDREAQRSFRIDRMKGEVTTGPAGCFLKPESIEGVLLRKWEIGNGASTPARVLIDAALAPGVLAEDPELRVVETLADGAVILELEVRNIAGLCSFMMNFLDRAEILAPEEFRTAIVDWLNLLVVEAAEGRP